jgi:predicted phosphodiesterase
MRYLVLSDLHSNLEAFETSLAEGRELGYDRVLVLGDLVGYGPDPNGVLDALRGMDNATIIRGNHDRVAAGLSEAGDFNIPARLAAEWTHRTLRAENLEYLKSLPRGPVPFASGRLLAHGTPLDEDTYLLDVREAIRCFAEIDFELCLFGHTHFPAVFTRDGELVKGQLLRGDLVEVPLRPGVRHMLNPGSLGQPRDRNPKCSFALYDAEAGTFTVHRIEYAVEKVRRKILDAGLPATLGDRLRSGV